MGRRGAQKRPSGSCQKCFMNDPVIRSAASVYRTARSGSPKSRQNAAAALSAPMVLATVKVCTPRRSSQRSHDCLRQAVGVAVLDHPVGGPDDQLFVDTLDELDVSVRLEVLAERPEDQRGLVLLDGEDFLPVECPGVPARGERAGRVVLVQEVSLVLDHAGRESEEPSAEFALAGQDERVRAERAVAGPAVGVMVATELGDVGVVGRDDRAAVVDLGPQDQRRAGRTCPRRPRARRWCRCSLCAPMFSSTPRSGRSSRSAPVSQMRRLSALTSS